MEVAQQMYRLTPRGRTLLLGVIPEFHSMFQDLYAVDFDPEMIQQVWPGDTLIKQAHLGDWRTMEFEDSYFDAIIGDGALGSLGDLVSIQEFLARAVNWLRPGGVFAHRMFERPIPAITLENLQSDIVGTTICWNAFKMKLLFYVAEQNIGEDVAEQNIGEVKFADVLSLFNTLVTDRDSTPWSREQVDTIDLYDGLSGGTMMLDRGQHRSVFPENSDYWQLAITSGYDLAEYCPIMIWKRPI